MSDTAGYDLIVSDDNVTSRIDDMNTIKEEFQNTITAYCECLRIIIEEGFAEGDVSENLAAFYQSAIILKDEFTYIIDDYAEIGKGFVFDVDEADSYLY